MKKLIYLFITSGLCIPFYSSATKIIVLGHVNSVSQETSNGVTLTTINQQSGSNGEVSYTIEDDQPSTNVITTSDPTPYLDQLNTNVDWTLRVNDVNSTSSHGSPNSKRPPIINLPAQALIYLGDQ